MVGEGHQGRAGLTQHQCATLSGQGFCSGRCRLREAKVLREPHLMQKPPLRLLGVDPPGHDLAQGTFRHGRVDQREDGSQLLRRALRPWPVEHPLLFHAGRQSPGTDRKPAQQGVGSSGDRCRPEHKDGQKSFQTARHFKEHFFKAE